MATCKNSICSKWTSSRSVGSVHWSEHQHANQWMIIFQIWNMEEASKRIWPKMTYEIYWIISREIQKTVLLLTKAVYPAWSFIFGSVPLFKSDRTLSELPSRAADHMPVKKRACQRVIILKIRKRKLPKRHKTFKCHLSQSPSHLEFDGRLGLKDERCRSTGSHGRPCWILFLKKPPLD